MEKLTEAEKSVINANIGVDGQDDTIYETVEIIFTNRITAERKRIAGFMALDSAYKKCAGIEISFEELTPIEKGNKEDLAWKIAER